MQSYDKFRDIQDYTSDDVLPWLEGFVQSVGAEEAARLLKGVGELEPNATIFFSGHKQAEQKSIHSEQANATAAQ